MKRMQAIVVVHRAFLVHLVIATREAVLIVIPAVVPLVIVIVVLIVIAAALRCRAPHATKPQLNLLLVLVATAEFVLHQAFAPLSLLIQTAFFARHVV